MSMRDYPIRDHGLFLSPELMNLILLWDWNPDITKTHIQDILDNRYTPGQDDCPADLLPDFWEAVNLLRDNDVEVVTCTSFCGSTDPMKVQWKDRNDLPYRAKPDIKYHDDAQIAYIPLENAPEILEPQPYSSPEAILFELEQKLAPFLPKGVDLRPWIMEIEGTYFC